MAIVSVIKYESPDDSVFVWKYPLDQIRLGSQLIVNEGQKAIFVKGGQIFDVFLPGTHTLTTGNLPLIDKLINLPFGGDTPFSAEIWFVNTTVKRDLKWGTPSPIPLMDPTLGFPVSVRAFGKWGASIVDAQLFVVQIVGSQVGADSNKIHNYFIGEIIQTLTKYLSSVIARGEASVLQVGALLNEISTQCNEKIKIEFEKFGIHLVNFNIESVNIPEDELNKVQDVYAKTLEANELSKANVSGAYATIKSFEVMDNAASNQSDGLIGGMLGAGIGLGAGFPMGQQMASKVTTEISNSDNNLEKSDPIEKLKKLKIMLDEGLITKEIYDRERDKVLGGL